MAAAALVGTAVGAAGTTAYNSSRGVEGDLGTIIKKFHLYKKKYFSLNSLRECILYVVNHGGKYRFYFDKNKKAKKNVGQQLTDGDVGGSSPPGGNIFGWSFSPSEGRIEGKYVPAVIKLSPHEDKVKLSWAMGISEYTGFNGEKYKDPIIFGINTHTAYSDETRPEITDINGELIDYLNKGIANDDCNEPEPGSMGVESVREENAQMAARADALQAERDEALREAAAARARMRVESARLREEIARAGTGISLDNELIKNRELIYSKIEEKEKGNVRLRELIDKINKNEATGPEIAEKDKLEVDLDEMDAEITKLMKELTWQ